MMGILFLPDNNINNNNNNNKKYDRNIKSQLNYSERNSNHNISTNQ